MDCYFDLLDGADTEAIQFPAVWDGAGVSTCVVEGRRLRCANVGLRIESPGTWPIELQLSDEILPGAASIVVTAPIEDQLRIALEPEEPVIFEGRPLSMFSRAPDGTGESFLNVRVRGSSRVLDTLAFEPGTFDEGRLNRFTLDLAPGRYRVWPCVGASALDCQELPGGHVLQVLDPTLIELIPGHNRRSGHRINIVFSGSGVGGSASLIEIANLTLGMGGPITVDEAGQPTDNPELIRDLHFGPMAIEPLRSNADKFNFWVLPDDLNSDLALVAKASNSNELDIFGLPNVHVTTFYDGTDTGGTSDARASSYFGRQTVPPRANLEFGGARVSVDPAAPVPSSETLAHEWGHGIFELRDEYFGFDGRPILIGYPNCAPDLITATAWWNSSLGEIDPFVDEVIAARVDAGLVGDVDAAYAELSNAVMVQPVVGGCYGNAGQGNAVRPSIDSLMNTEIPVFGTVNRQRVEILLARFEVGGPLAYGDDVAEVACVARSERLFCDGALAPAIAPPSDATLTAEGAPCRFDAEASPVTFSCFSLDPGGDEVALVFGDEELDAAIERPPEPVEPPSTTTTSTTAAPIETSPTSGTLDESPQNPIDGQAASDQDQPSGGDPNWRMPVIVGAIVAGLSIASAMLKRRSDNRAV